MFRKNEREKPFENNSEMIKMSDVKAEHKACLYPIKIFDCQHPSKIKKILVLDLDSCAITIKVGSEGILNMREDMISPTLIEHVKSSSYDAFYVCTHRSIKTTFEAAFASLVKYSMANSNLNPISISTTMIIKNLEKALGISCLAVSTPDDFCLSVPTNDPLKQCGYGFENIIKPYEQKLMELNKDLIQKNKYEGYQTIPVEKNAYKRSYAADDNSKNNQLILIGEHASITFHEFDISLYFRDDKEEICSTALKISKSALPENVKLYITQDRPFYGIVRTVGAVKGSKPISIAMSKEQKDIAQYTRF
jgi:hypothetical protein